MLILDVRLHDWYFLYTLSKLKRQDWNIIYIMCMLRLDVRPHDWYALHIFSIRSFLSLKLGLAGELWDVRSQPSRTIWFAA